MKQETWKFHENQVFQQLHDSKIWFTGDNGEKAESSFLHEAPTVDLGPVVQN